MFEKLRNERDLYDLKLRAPCKGIYCSRCGRVTVHRYVKSRYKLSWNESRWVIVDKYYCVMCGAPNDSPLPQLGWLPT